MAGGGIVLWGGYPDLGGAAGGGNPGFRPDWTGGSDRTNGWVANGDAAMNPRRRRLGFILAAAGMLAALVLPLSSEAAGGLRARPILLALTLAAALLLAAASWPGGLPAIAAGLAGGLCRAAT